MLLAGVTNRGDKSIQAIAEYTHSWMLNAARTYDFAFKKSFAAFATFTQEYTSV